MKYKYSAIMFALASGLLASGNSLMYATDGSWFMLVVSAVSAVVCFGFVVHVSLTGEGK